MTTRITFADALSSYPKCPVCDGVERKPCRPESFRYSPYTQALAEALQVEIPVLYEAMPLWVCRRCQSIWHDPWLSNGTAKRLYHELFPMHRAGQIAVAWWLQDRRASFLATRTTVWKLFRDRLGGPLRYAEFNCPFNGLALDELRARYGDRARELMQGRITQIANPGAVDRPPIPPVGEGLFRDRTLLLANSPLCWGEGCRSTDGIRCRDLATTIFDRVVTMEAAEAAGERFDLVGAYITIDHMPDPNRTLFRLLRMTRCVLVEIHVPEIPDLQHLYNISPTFLDLVRSTGVHVRDVTEQAFAHEVVEPPYRALFYLLSRSDDMAWLG